MGAGMQPNSGKKSLMWLWIIVGVVIVGGAMTWFVAAQDFFKSTNQTTTNKVSNTSVPAQKSYVDPQGRYAFVAPPMWTATKLVDPKAGFEITRPSSTSRIYVNVVANPDDLTIADRFAQFDDTSRLWFGTYPHAATTINGLPAERFASFREDGMAFSRVEVIISGERQLGLLSYQYTTDDSLAAFDQIVASFGFR